MTNTNVFKNSLNTITKFIVDIILIGKDELNPPKGKEQPRISLAILMVHLPLELFQVADAPSDLS